MKRQIKNDKNTVNSFILLNRNTTDENIVNVQSFNTQKDKETYV